MFDGGMAVDAVHLAFGEAFDYMPHGNGTLIKKIKANWIYEEIRNCRYWNLG